MNSRIEIEKRITRSAVEGLIKAGFKVSVHDTEVEIIKPTDDVEEVIKALYTVDEEYLRAYSDEQGGYIGWVRFIYGNCGWDVIDDYTIDLEDALADTLKLADSLDTR